MRLACQVKVLLFGSMPEPAMRSPERMPDMMYVPEPSSSSSMRKLMVFLVMST